MIWCKSTHRSTKLNSAVERTNCTHIERFLSSHPLLSGAEGSIMKLGRWEKIYVTFSAALSLLTAKSRLFQLSSARIESHPVFRTHPGCPLSLGAQGQSEAIFRPSDS